MHIPVQNDIIYVKSIPKSFEAKQRWKKEWDSVVLDTDRTAVCLPLTATLPISYFQLSFCLLSEGQEGGRRGRLGEEWKATSEVGGQTRQCQENWSDEK